MKIAVVGGGSTYTPELVDGVARLTGALKVTELTLVDPDESRLAVVGPVSARIMRAYGHPARVSWTTDLDAGIDGAGAVLLQLRVGGQAARQRDETWPLECGCIGQETTGAGGLAKALRTVPIVLDIAERARQRADPGAWIIDFTNPVGIVTRALLDAGHRAVGLCNVAIGFQRLFARLLAAHGEEIASHTGLPASVLHDVGAVPSYYLRYFWAHDAVVAEERTRPTRAEEVAEIERGPLALSPDPDLDYKPELLSERGGAYYSEAAVALLASLVGDTGDTQVVNVRNGGTFPFLPDDAVTEVPAVIGAAGARPVLAAPLPPLMRGLVAHVSAYEELAVDAALRGGRDRVRATLLAHPLVGQLDLADGLTDRLLAENRDFLPWAHE